MTFVGQFEHTKRSLICHVPCQIRLLCRRGRHRVPDVATRNITGRWRSRSGRSGRAAVVCVQALRTRGTGDDCVCAVSSSALQIGRAQYSDSEGKEKTHHKTPPKCSVRTHSQCGRAEHAVPAAILWPGLSVCLTLLRRAASDRERPVLFCLGKFSAWCPKKHMLFPSFACGVLSNPPCPGGSLVVLLFEVLILLAFSRVVDCRGRRLCDGCMATYSR